MNLNEAQELLYINPYIILNDKNIDPDIIFKLAESVNFTIEKKDRYRDLFDHDGFELKVTNFSLFNSASINSNIIHNYIKDKIKKKRLAL